jgi:RNA recognition motif-containing protein
MERIAGQKCGIKLNNEANKAPSRLADRSTLYISNLTPQVDDNDIKQFFSQVVQ